MHREIYQYVTFAGEAEQLAMAGAACWLVALLALLADRRRHARRELYGVGWMPWTGIFLSFAVLGGGLLFMAMPALLGSQ